MQFIRCNTILLYTFCRRDAPPDEEHVDPDLLELISMWREGHKVTLPADLGIVYTEAETSDATDDRDVLAPALDPPARVTLTRDEAMDLVDLAELGGRPDWPSGWTLNEARNFLFLQP